MLYRTVGLTASNCMIEHAPQPFGHLKKPLATRRVVAQDIAATPASDARGRGLGILWNSRLAAVEVTRALDSHGIEFRQMSDYVAGQLFNGLLARGRCGARPGKCDFRRGTGLWR